MDSRIETLLKALLNGDSVEDFIPQSRAEAYLKSCILKEGVADLPDPQSRLDALLYELAGIMPTLGSGDVQLQTKTATPAVNEVIVRPDTGYALSRVTIEAVSSAIDANIKAENILDGVTILGVEGNNKGYDAGYNDGVAEASLPSQEKTVSPEVETQVVTPDEGYALSKVTVNPVTKDVDANIKSENILDGVTILGVEGSDKGYDAGYRDGSEAATVPTQEKTVAPEAVAKIVVPDDGYSLSKVTVNPVTKDVDENIKAENIKEGVSILGVAGSEKGYDAGRQEEYNTFWDVYQLDKNSAYSGNYLCKFAGFAWNSRTFKPRYDIVPTSTALQMFFHFNENENISIDLTTVKKGNGEILDIDLSNCKNLNSVFSYAKVSHIGVVDCKSVPKADGTYAWQNMFTGCGATTIDLLKLYETNPPIHSGMFTNCNYLTHVIFEGVIASSISLASCSLLDAESILSIFRTLKKYAKTDTGYLANTLTLNAKAWTTINTAYHNGTEDMPFGEITSWQDYALSIGWNT